MLNKTKAALQGRLSHFSDIAENNSTLIDQVNARRFAHIFSGYGQPIVVTAAMAQTAFSRASLIRWFYSASSAPSKVKGGVSIIGHTPQGVVNSLISSRNAIGDTGITVSGERHRAGGADLPTVSGLAQPQNEVTEEIRDLPIHAEAFPQIWGDRQSPEKSGGQPFGSIPALRNFALPNSLSQLARLTPSAFACCSNCSFSSGLMRIRNCGDCPSPFGLLSRLIVDKWSPILIRLILLGGHLNTVGSIKTTPRSARNTYRASDQKPLIGVTAMAEQQHTQTHPKFTWRFLAINRADMAAKPCRLSVEAETESDARRVLAPHFILSLAARLPVSEVRHV